MRKTEIIDFYANSFEKKMREQGVLIDKSACYAVVSNRFWERMRIICDIDTSTFIEFPVGAWGQFLIEEPRIGLRKGICCLLYTSPSPRDDGVSRMPSSA